MKFNIHYLDPKRENLTQTQQLLGFDTMTAILKPTDNGFKSGQLLMVESRKDKQNYQCVIREVATTLGETQKQIIKLELKQSLLNNL